MPILTGSLSARLFRVLEPLPPGFAEEFDKNLRRHAFRPPDPEKGQLRAMGWVNIRQVLDARLSLNKTLFDGVIAVALRVDRIVINQRLFRATLAEEVAKVLRGRQREGLGREQRAALEEQVRLKLLRAQSPAMSIYEMAWHMERGLVFFAATGDKLSAEFADLFTQTFSLSLEPLYPFLRAQRWARRQRSERDLLELLPAPFSPKAPLEVVEIAPGEEEGA